MSLPIRLPRFSDIGLRVLIYLEPAGERPHHVTVAEIGKQFAIPPNHLVKVVGRLAKLGWVTSIRGRNGGLRLAADAHTLAISQVLRKLEGEEDERVDCEGTNCALKLDCQLRAGMRAFHALRAEVDGLTPVMPNLSVVNFHEHADAGADVVAGRMDVRRLPAWPLEEAQVYVCGPRKFNAGAVAGAAGPGRAGGAAASRGVRAGTAGSPDLIAAPVGAAHANV